MLSTIFVVRLMRNWTRALIVLVIIAVSYFAWSQYAHSQTVNSSGTTLVLCDIFTTNCSGDQVRVGGYLLLSQGAWELVALTGQSCNTSPCKTQDLFHLTLSSSIASELAAIPNSNGSWVNVSGVITQPSAVSGFDGDIAVNYIAFSTLTIS